MAGHVAHLRGGEGDDVAEGSAFGGVGRAGQHRFGLKAVAGQQVLHQGGIVAAGELLPQDLQPFAGEGPPLRRPQDRRGGGGLMQGPTQAFLDGPEGVEGHRAAGGPLAAHQADQGGGQGFHRVFAHEAGRTAAFPPLRQQQGATSGPAAGDHRLTMTGEPAAHVIQQIGLLLGTGPFRLVAGTGHVRGAHQGAPEKGEHEQHPTIVGGRHQQTGAGGTEAALEHQVHAPADLHPGGGIGVGQPADGVSPDSGGIEHHPGLLPPATAVVPLQHRSAQPAVRVPQQVHHLRAGAHPHAQGCGGAHNQQIEACVVELTVAVGHPAVAGGQRGQQLPHLGGGHPAAPADAPTARQGVVDRQADAVIGLAQKLAGGQQQFEAMGQERHGLEPVAALGQGLAHQEQLAAVKAAEGQLEVAHATMEQLGAAAAGATGDVATFHQGD